MKRTHWLNRFLRLFGYELRRAVGHRPLDTAIPTAARYHE